jgi:hypothetical protein
VLFCKRWSQILDYGRVYASIADFLKGEGFPVAVVGAFALHAFGITRATQDLDLVTHVEARARLVTHLESLGYETLYVSAGYSNHLHQDPALGRVDLVYVSGETQRLLFAGCRERFSLGGHAVLVPRAEHLVAMKVQAIKNDPARSFQDMADIRSLLLLPDIDHAEVERYFVRAGLQDKLNEIRKTL